MWRMLTLPGMSEQSTVVSISASSFSFSSSSSSSSSSSFSSLAPGVRYMSLIVVRADSLASSSPSATFVMRTSPGGTIGTGSPGATTALLVHHCVSERISKINELDWPDCNSDNHLTFENFWWTHNCVRRERKVERRDTRGIEAWEPNLRLKSPPHCSCGLIHIASSSSQSNQSWCVVLFIGTHNTRWIDKRRLV